MEYAQDIMDDSGVYKNQGINMTVGALMNKYCNPKWLIIYFFTLKQNTETNDR